MLNLISAEFFKLKKSTGFKLCLLITCICAWSLISVSHGIGTGDLSTDISGSASGLTEIMVISLLGSLLAGILVCSDFESKTIHDAIAGGNGRISVVISKVFVYLLLICLLFLPYAFATLIGLYTYATFSSSFAISVFINILADMSGQSITFSMAGNILLLSLVTGIVYAARLSICIPVAFKVRKPIVVMAFGFAAGFIIDLIAGAAEGIPLLSDLLTVTPFYRDYLMISMDSSDGIMLKAAIVSLLFLSIMTGITYLLFKKAEIK